MTPEYLRALQAAILASQACAEHVITNDAPKAAADQARAANGSNTVNFPAWKFEIADPT